ncbi:MAG: nitroreductase [Pseudohongiellaceae bacterium]
MDAIEALHKRTSYARLVEPVPTPDELEQIFKAALRAPDHAMLRPWHYLLIQGDARKRLGELFVAGMQPDSDAQRDKLLNAPLRAPMIIVAAARLQEHPKVPRIEQISSTAAGVQNMSLALYALGYASIWRTGPVAFNARIKEGLGLDRGDEIVGYLYLGTATLEKRPVPEHNVADYFEAWEKPCNHD